MIETLNQQLKFLLLLSQPMIFGDQRVWFMRMIEAVVLTKKAGHRYLKHENPLPRMNFCSYIFPLISINGKEKLDKRFRKNTIRKNYYF